MSLRSNVAGNVELPAKYSAIDPEDLEACTLSFHKKPPKTFIEWMGKVAKIKLVKVAHGDRQPSNLPKPEILLAIARAGAQTPEDRACVERGYKVGGYSYLLTGDEHLQDTVVYQSEDNITKVIWSPWSYEKLSQLQEYAYNMRLEDLQEALGWSTQTAEKKA